ncbi:MAG: trehalose-6-phosphate synthase [Myxococcales bacterium]|nr:trehalose-6-phosphate synthase [Myxococcales bacterium]
MRRTWKFLVGLLVGLAALTGTADQLMQRTLRRWFERDLQLRSDLVLHGMERALSTALQLRDSQRVADLLIDITRDDRIMAAALCSRDGQIAVATPELPAELHCPAVLERIRQAAALPLRDAISLHTGRVHLTLLPFAEATQQPTVIALVHDLSFVDRRESAGRAFLLVAFFVLGAAASILALLLSRGLWRSWTDTLRRQLRSDVSEEEFQPLVSEVRALVGELSRVRDHDRQEGRWSPARLRDVLRSYVQGEQVLLLANREPYIHTRDASGQITVLHPASGLVTAVEPVMRACSGVWIAHGSGSADRETADADGRLRVPPGSKEEDRYWLRRVWLTEDEERGYYYGFANEGLWALCHLAHARPEFRGHDFEQYRHVNQRFADAVCAEAQTEDPIVLVQDYHFALAPALIRQRLPKAMIITFWHIPWPSAERFGICPWHRELLAGLLGSSIVGFHTQAHCNNFLEAVDRFLESRIDHSHNAVVRRGHTTLVRPYPISIAWPNPWAEQAPSVSACRESVRKELGLSSDALIGLGIDRIDYTKGIEERLLAAEALLEQHPELRGRFVFVQLGAPSRTVIPRYRALNESLEALAARINERFGTDRYKPIVFSRAHHEPPTVFRYYRAAEFCYVSSLHDGMNLVAKEFIAARDDEQSVLLLSQFAGAAHELTEALIVNPYDIGQASAAMHAALTMTAAAQRDRMRALRSLVAEFNVYRWAGRMLLDAARLRERERLKHRLRETSTSASAPDLPAWARFGVPL